MVSIVSMLCQVVGHLICPRDGKLVPVAPQRLTALVVAMFVVEVKYNNFANCETNNLELT